MSNYVQKFTLDNQDILCKDSEARQSMTTFTGDLALLSQRVTNLEGLSRLTVAYDSTNETINITTTTHN